MQRAFRQFTMFPIAQLMRAMMSDNKNKYTLESLSVVLNGDDKALTGKPIMSARCRAGLTLLMPSCSCGLLRGEEADFPPLAIVEVAR